MEVSQKYVRLQKVLDELQIDHSDIENHMKRLAEMDTKVEVLKRRNLDLEKLIEKLKQDSELERSKINEELDIEREKVLQLQKLEIQVQAYKKKIEDLSGLQQEVIMLEDRVRGKDDQIRQLEHELATKKQSVEAVKKLKEEVNNAMVKISQLELELQNKGHSIQDLTNQLKISKRKEELALEKAKHLELECEGHRQKENQLNSSRVKDDLQA